MPLCPSPALGSEPMAMAMRGMSGGKGNAGGIGVMPQAAGHCSSSRDSPAWPLGRDEILRVNPSIGALESFGRGLTSSLFRIYSFPLSIFTEFMAKRRGGFG
jgi:hypothetical protein